MNNITLSELESLIDAYVHAVRAELVERWSAWTLDLSNPELHEVVGALLARQVSLATQLARSPGIWTPHVSPIILRAMVDAYMTLAWILKDPPTRCHKFVIFGLGQEKLKLEHRKSALQAEGKEPADDFVVSALGEWIDSQRFTFLTEVNVGSWSELPVRKMAEEAGCLDLYQFVYTPYSAVVHSMWNHVSKFNLLTCHNPLHRLHRVPTDPELQPDFDFLYRAAKYVEKTFDLFDRTFSVQVKGPSAFNALRKFLNGEKGRQTADSLVAKSESSEEDCGDGGQSDSQ